MKRCTKTKSHYLTIDNIICRLIMHLWYKHIFLFLYINVQYNITAAWRNSSLRKVTVFRIVHLKANFHWQKMFPLELQCSFFYRLSKNIKVEYGLTSNVPTVFLLRNNSGTDQWRAKIKDLKSSRTTWQSSHEHNSDPTILSHGDNQFSASPYWAATTLQGDTVFFLCVCVCVVAVVKLT